MEKLSYFDYSALAVLLVLIITVMVRKMLSGRRNRYYLYVILVVLFSVIFDIAAVWLDNSGSTNAFAKYLAHGGYLIFHNLSTPVFITYLVELTGTRYRLVRNRLLMALLAVPFVSAGILTFTAPWNHLVYYLDENYVYTRGPWFVVLYISAACYVVCGVIYLIRYRHLFDRWEMVAGIGLFVAMPVAVIAQFFNPNIPVEMFSQALSALLIMLVIQRPEERLDQVTGFSKYAAYAADMTRAFVIGKPIHIILLHITNFKWLNDLLGYGDTNDMLKTIALRIRDVIASGFPGVEAYHFGRGVYALTVEPGHFSRTEELAQAVQAEMRGSLEIKHMDINVAVQLCIIHCPEDFSDARMLLAFGNDFEWQNNAGHVLHASEIIRKENYEMVHHLDTIIEEAFIHKRFSVYYQPIYSVKEGRFHSAEALVRLEDERYGFISPELFIPIAERNGAIHRIGSYVLEEVCRFIASDEFQRLGLDYIEVNLSIVQCMRSDLVQEVRHILDKYQVDSRRINLEITETAASYAQNIMLENINELSKAGVAISLDDFGTGYSNMQRMASLPLQIVKLDKTFTRLGDNPRMEIVVRNLVRMIKDMELQIVAEGIETGDMVRQFSELDCEYIQGFYYSKPLPKEEFIAFIRQKNGV